MQIRVTDELLAQIRARSRAERKAIGDVMNTVVASWGAPHLHVGISVRRLTKTVYECRVGLDDRLAFVFTVTPPELVFFFLGNHGQVQKLIRSLQ